MEVLSGIVLENSKSLNIFRLRTINFRPCINPQGQESVVLQKLTEFALLDIMENSSGTDEVVKNDIVVRMLRRFLVPSCTSFAVRAAFSKTLEVMQEELFCLIPSPHRLFTRSLSNSIPRSKPPMARIRFLENDGFELHASGKGGSLPHYLDLRKVSQTTVRRWTKEVLVEGWPEQISRLYLNLEYGVDGNRWPMNNVFEFEDSGIVVGLKVTGKFRAKQSVRTANFASRLGSRGSSGSVPFSRLRTLILSNCYIPGEEVLEMVQKRSVVRREEGQRPTSSGLTENEGLTIILDLDEKGVELSEPTMQQITATEGIKDIQQYTDGEPPGLCDEND
ncbi:hypothetical protein FRB90_008605, partial [Tulasnella sp. 427]